MSNKELSWVRVQEQAFTQWMNETVKARKMEVEDLRTDLKDGLRLVAFFEILAGHNMVVKYNKRPTQRIHMINNLATALRFMESDLHVQNPGCSAEDIIDADTRGIKLILGMLWVLYRKYRMAVAGGKKGREEDQLLEWVRTVLREKGFEELVDEVQSFRSSFNDGTLFLALAKAYDGESGDLDYEHLKDADTKEKLAAAFDYAEERMNVSKLLEVDEVAEYQMDERAMALYTSLFYHAFKNQAEMAEMQGIVGASAEELELQKKGKEELIKMNRELTEQLAALQAELDATKKELAELKQAHSQTEDEVETLKKHTSRQKKTIAEKEEEVSELQAQSRINSNGLGVLRTNLEAHISDLRTWQKLLEGKTAEVEDPLDEVRHVEADMNGLSFQEQLNIISSALQDESVQMAQIIAERKKEVELKSGGNPKTPRTPRTPKTTKSQKSGVPDIADPTAPVLASPEKGKKKKEKKEKKEKEDKEDKE